MTTLRKLLGLVAVVGALTFGTPAEGEADVFDCWENGACSFVAGCSGDLAWDPPCRVQCWTEGTCPPFGTYCLIAAGSAECGSRVG